MPPIVKYTAIKASVHDSQVIFDLMDEQDQVVYWGRTVLPKHIETRFS